MPARPGRPNAAQTMSGFIAQDESEFRPQVRSGEGLRVTPDQIDSEELEVRLAGLGDGTSLDNHALGTSYDSFDRVASGNIGGTETHYRAWLDTTQFECTGTSLIKLGAGYGIQSFEAHSQFGVVRTKVTANAASEWWLMFRMQDGTNYMRAGVMAGAYTAQKVVDNGLVGFTFVTTLADPPVPADGDEIEVWLWPDDGIDVFINGVHTWTIGDTTFITERIVGVACNGRGVEFDYFAHRPM